MSTLTFLNNLPIGGVGIPTLLGMLTIGGVGALALFVPAVGVFVGAIVQLLLSNRLTVGLLCLLVGLVVGHYRGVLQEQAIWQQANYQEQLKKLKLQSDIANAATADASQKLKELEADNASLEAQVVQFKARIASLGNACLVGPDAGFLRNIVGGP
jgi:apolipoprotein N-acyltransferase